MHSQVRTSTATAYRLGEGIVLDTAASWHVEHLHFQRLLAFLEDQLRVCREGYLPNYNLMGDVTNFFSYFGNRYHHAREGVAFGYIKSNPAMDGTISRLVQEHADITDKGEKLNGLLARAVEGTAIARDSIEYALAEFLIAYQNHILAEEESILPYAAENLSAMQWESVASAKPSGPDPYRRNGASRHKLTFGSEAETRYLALSEKIRTAGRARATTYRVRCADEHQKNGAGNKTHVTGSLKVSRPQTIVPGVRPVRRQSVRQSIGLLALVLAFLQYYYFDIQLQIQRLPSIFPGALQ